MARLARAISRSLSIPPCTESNHSTSPSGLFLSIAIESGLLLLYYTILSCPVLSCPVLCTYTHTHKLKYVFGAAWFFGCVLDTHIHTISSPTVATVSVAQMSGLLQLHLNRAALHGTGCTALAALHWHCRLGLDWMDGGVGLGCRESERAKRLSYCAARLVSLSLSHHWALSTFKFLLTGSPRQFQPAFPPLLPRLDSVISLFLSPLNLERISGQLDNSASHLTSKPAFLLSTHQWDGPCSSFLTVWTSLIDRFLVPTPRAIP